MKEANFLQNCLKTVRELIAIGYGSAVITVKAREKELQHMELTFTEQVKL